MKKMQCEVCGSTDIKKIDDTTFECQSCGVQYSKEEAVKLLVELDDIPQESFQKRTNDAFSSNDGFGHENMESVSKDHFKMTNVEVLTITGKGKVICGRIVSGTIRTNEYILVNRNPYKVLAIESCRKILKEANAGMDVGLLISTDNDLRFPDNISITK